MKFELPLELTHNPADYAEAVEMLNRAKGLLAAKDRDLAKAERQNFDHEAAIAALQRDLRLALSKTKSAHD